MLLESRLSKGKQDQSLAGWRAWDRVDNRCTRWYRLAGFIFLIPETNDDSAGVKYVRDEHMASADEQIQSFGQDTPF
jgi:hypothetical protein